MKKNSFISRVVCASFVLFPVITHAQLDGNLNLWPHSSSPASNEKIELQAEKLLAKMTLEQKVGQIVQAEIQSITPEQVKKYHIGSVLNGGGSMPGRKEDANVHDWLALADAYYEASVDTSGRDVAIPIIWGTDAVHGNGNLIGATLFPHNIGLGAAHNSELIRKIGAVTAREVRSTGIEWVFAPTLAVAQNDLWGRTYESYSEDPALVREYATAMVEGLQGKASSMTFLDADHVIATAKHFLADGGTEAGDDQGDARVSEKALVDIHNAGYPAAIEAGVQSVMISFSSWNGEKNHGNRYLIHDVLKGRMGFDGLVVGDWNGHGQLPNCSNDSCPDAINAGIDMLMVPSDWQKMIENTLSQVRAGEIPLMRLDDAVRRILRVKLRMGVFARKPSDRMVARNNKVIGSAQHRALARQAVRESLVLLKNRNNILPLKPSQTILVAGSGADSISMQSGGWSVSWQGNGIANEKFPGATSIYAGIKAAVETAGGKALLVPDGQYAQKPDVAIIVFGERPYAEGRGDLSTLEYAVSDKQSLALLKSLQAKGIPTVSIFLSGRPLWVNPEINASDAFVAAWLPGTEGAGIADVIIAQANGKPKFDFQGKLSFSWPKNPLQSKLNPKDANYDPLFALGYGLDYTGAGQGPHKLEENVPGLALAASDTIPLYDQRPLQPWVIRINDLKQEQQLNSAFATLSNGHATVVATDKDVQEDALTFTWKDTSFAALSLRYGDPLELSGFVAQGVISFDIKVDELTKGSLELMLQCAGDCERKLDLTPWALSRPEKTWQQLSIKLGCLAQDGDDFSQVPVPFELRGGGSGQVAVANIRLQRQGESNLDCAGERKPATTPATHDR